MFCNIHIKIVNSIENLFKLKYELENLQLPGVCNIDINDEFLYIELVNTNWHYKVPNKDRFISFINNLGDQGGMMIIEQFGLVEYYGQPKKVGLI